MGRAAVLIDAVGEGSSISSYVIVACGPSATTATKVPSPAAGSRPPLPVARPQHSVQRRASTKRCTMGTR